MNELIKFIGNALNTDELNNSKQSATFKSRVPNVSDFIPNVSKSGIKSNNSEKSAKNHAGYKFPPSGINIPPGCTGPYIEITNQGFDIGLRGTNGNSSLFKVNLGDQTESNKSNNADQKSFNTKTGKRTKIKANLSGPITADIEGKIEQNVDGPTASININIDPNTSTDSSYQEDRPNERRRGGANIHYNFDITEELSNSLDDINTLLNAQSNKSHRNGMSNNDTKSDNSGTTASKSSNRPHRTYTGSNSKNLTLSVESPNDIRHNHKQSILKSHIPNKGPMGLKHSVSRRSNAEKLLRKCTANRINPNVRTQSIINRDNSDRNGTGNNPADLFTSYKSVVNPMSELLSGRTPRVNASSNLFNMIRRSSAPSRTEPIIDINNSNIGVINSGLDQIKMEEIPFENEEIINYDNNVTYGNDKVEGSYYNDLDIVAIDRIICNKIGTEVTKIPIMWRIMDKLKHQIERCPYDQNIIREIKSYQTKIKEIQQGVKLRSYQRGAKPLLQLYMKTRKTNVVEFGQETQEKPNVLLLKIISQYIEVARPYILINLLRSEDEENLCIQCKASLKDIHPGINGCLRCPQCNTETIPLQQEIVQSDPNKHIGKGGYDDIKTFKKAIECYIGGQQVTFPDQLIKQLDEYFIANRQPIGIEIRSYPLIGDFEGRRRRGKTSRCLMINALRDTGNSKHYKDSFLLCRNYWGWENPNLSGVYNLIIEHYEKTQPLYNLLKEKDGRKSSLGRGYRLFRHLWHVNYPCHPSEFGIVQTEEILILYERIWKEICDTIGRQLGWRPFVSIRSLFMMDPDTLEMPKTFD